MWAMEPEKPVTRLFPFAINAGILVVGREKLARMSGKLCFIMLATDISEGSENAMRLHHRLKEIPFIKRYSSQQIEAFFGLTGVKIVGFVQNPLSKSILQELLLIK